VRDKQAESTLMAPNVCQLNGAHRVLGKGMTDTHTYVPIKYNIYSMVYTYQLLLLR